MIILVIFIITIIMIIIVSIWLLDRILRLFPKNKTTENEITEIYNSLINLKIGDSYKIKSEGYLVTNVTITKEKQIFTTLYSNYIIILEKDNKILPIIKNIFLIPLYIYKYINFSRPAQNIPKINMYYTKNICVITCFGIKYI